MPADLQRVTEWPQRKLLAFEKDSLGFYVSGHPLDRFADQIEQYATACVEDLRGMDYYACITLCGIQTAYKARPLKSGDGRMGIITFEDHDPLLLRWT
jgi:DNA polymerase-3 subunit alpha